MECWDQDSKCVQCVPILLFRKKRLNLKIKLMLELSPFLQGSQKLGNLLASEKAP